MGPMAEIFPEDELKGSAIVSVREFGHRGHIVTICFASHQVAVTTTALSGTAHLQRRVSATFSRC